MEGVENSEWEQKEANGKVEGLNVRGRR
jgi:hypothetical protein